MVAPPAIALLYPTLLAFLTANPNYRIIPDDYGIPHMVDITETELTQTEIVEIEDSVLRTSFHLYTRSNPMVGQELIIDNLESVKNSSWNPKHPVRLVTHGWMGDCESTSCTLIRDAYLNSSDYNVILIDWSSTSKNIKYPRVVAAVSMVAKRVTLLLNFLESKAGLNPKRTSVIGHSLGGHVASLSARFANSKIAEVVSLDPAKIMFESKGPGERADRSDAITVQGIHTNAGFLGLADAIGASDFYPNDGKWQPGCTSDWSGACSHMRAYYYYAESITNPKGFRAGKVYMGGPTLDLNANGNYTLKTGNKPPFALG